MIKEDQRFALKAVKARQRGQAPSPREIEGLFRTYTRACNTWLYAIQAGGADGPVKIGKTQNPAQRLVTLQQGNGAELRGIAAWRAIDCEEKQLHKQFADARIRGEWFRPVPELLELVLALGGDFCDWELSDWEPE